MKTQNTLLKLLLVTTITLILSACNSKTNQEETNTSTIQNPTTQTTEDASTDGGSDANATGGTDDNTNTRKDVIPPVLTLNGEASVTLEQNAVYTELGATALDAVDGNISVIISGNVDTSTVGSYTVTYSATDSAGNEANITRTITVIDVTPPVITLNGEANVSLFVGSDYTELGATAVDAVDGNVTVAMSGTVDTSTAGTYVITYTVRDSVGNEANITRTVTVVVPVLTSLSLSSSATALNVGETAELTLMGTYSDNTSKTVTQGIAYVITPSSSVEVNGTVLTAKKDGNVTVQATVGGVKSNTLNLTITWVVDGHVLPPEPDPVVNNATLLGIDSNNNGVRDDVERWIYQNYKDKHPIHIDIAMQAARGYKLVLETPERAKEIRGEVNGALFCTSYYKFGAQLFNDPILVHERIDAPVMSKYFNTKERNNIYWQYDTLLSGGVYPLPEYDKRKSLCDFNTSKYNKE